MSARAPRPGRLSRRTVAAGLAATWPGLASAQETPRPPLRIKDWLLRRSERPMPIPLDYIGLHSLHGMDGKTPPPTYPYDAIRSHDVSDAKESSVTQWAQIERSPGTFDWSNVDRWIATHGTRTKIWVLFGCPTFYQKYPGEPFPYPDLPGGGSPPRDPRTAGVFIRALLDRHPRQIQYVEIWNEPSFAGGTNPLTDRWTPAMPKPGFFAGTASDLAEMARAVRAVLPRGVRLLAGAWEGQDTVRTAVSSLLRFSAAPDGAGGRGRDHVQALSVHSYTYNNDPNKMIAELRNYRDRFAEAGYPSSMPRLVTECGAEKPIDWTTASLSLADKVRCIKRWCLIPAALGYEAVYLYAHSLPNTLGDPANTPAIATAIGDKRNLLRARTMVESAVLEDDTLWAAFSDGTTVLA